METFKDFFAWKDVLDANHHSPENFQNFSHLQNCLRRKSSLAWKHSKIFCLQKCLRCKSSLSRKCSKTFSPARLSWPQTIFMLKIFKDFFASKIVLDASHHYPENSQILFSCKIVLAANHLYPESIQRLSALKIVLDANHQYPGNIQRFFACKIVLDAYRHYPEIIQRFFRLQDCLGRKPSLCWKYSKTFSPAKLSYLQIILILKIFKDFFACKIVFDATHHYPENSQKLFSCKIVLDANHHYPEKTQRLFRLPNCLSRKSSLSWKNSKTFSPAKLSYSQFIITLRTFKDFFACNIVLDANHHYPENIQRLFRL